MTQAKMPSDMCCRLVLISAFCFAQPSTSTGASTYSSTRTEMGLVDYSDSEGSDAEQPPAKAATSHPPTNFSVSKSNPRKIQVKLSDSATNGTHDDGPAPKRPRLGGGGMSGFNAMLPPPKRDAEKESEKQSALKAPARKVFSLKTGSEKAFSREADDELRTLFAEQEQDASKGTGGGQLDDDDVGLPEVPKRTVEETAIKGNTFMFKPLSVARGGNKKKKKTVNEAAKATSTPKANESKGSAESAGQLPSIPAPKKKIDLFSSGYQEEVLDLPAEPPDSLSQGPIDANDDDTYDQSPPATAPDAPQTLDSIASDLNLSAAERRQLFGRSSKSNVAATVHNFNTDHEYALNQQLLASGALEQAQHNPVRAIAPGKHSLRQLVNSAQTQKEALEESFVAGKRNKKEAGNRYGW